MVVTRLHILLVFNPLSGVQNRQIILKVFLSRMIINMNILKQKMNGKNLNERASSYIKDRFNYNDVAYGYQLKLIKRFGKINYNFMKY